MLEINVENYPKVKIELNELEIQVLKYINNHYFFGLFKEISKSDKNEELIRDSINSIVQKIKEAEK